MLPLLALLVATGANFQHASASLVVERSILAAARQQSPLHEFDYQSANVANIALLHLSGLRKNNSGSATPKGQHCIAFPDNVEPLCVYAAHAFCSKPGIALITVPSHAHKIFQTLKGETSAQLHSIDYQSSLIEEQLVPGAGRGMFARTAVPLGTKLFDATPMLLLHDYFYRLDESISSVLLRLAIQTLPFSERTKFWDLATMSGNDTDLSLDRIYTNSFSVELFGNRYAAILPLVARLNHHCRPNAAYYFDTVSLSHRVHVTRPVARGEQLTITYIDNMRPFKDRQRIIKEGWNFTCTCSVCAQSDSSIVESDSRLASILHWLKTLRFELEQTSFPLLTRSQAVDAAEKLLQLYNAEGLQSRTYNALLLAATANSLAGNYDAAKAFDRQALEAARREVEPNDAVLQDLETKAEEALMHGRWQPSLPAKGTMVGTI